MITKQLITNNFLNYRKIPLTFPLKHHYDENKNNGNFFMDYKIFRNNEFN